MIPSRTDILEQHLYGELWYSDEEITQEGKNAEQELLMTIPTNCSTLSLYAAMNLLYRPCITKGHINHFNILIVDDSVVARKMMTMTLVQGHKESKIEERIYIHHADSYYNALQIIKTKAFNVMIIDHMLNILDDQQDTSESSDKDTMIKTESDYHISTIENKEYENETSRQNLFVKDSNIRESFLFQNHQRSDELSINFHVDKTQLVIATEAKLCHTSESLHVANNNKQSDSKLDCNRRQYCLHDLSGQNQHNGERGNQNNVVENTIHPNSRSIFESYQEKIQTNYDDKAWNGKDIVEVIREDTPCLIVGVSSLIIDHDKNTSKNSQDAMISQKLRKEFIRAGADLVWSKPIPSNAWQQIHDVMPLEF